jgi:hypothetical protein
MVQIPVTVVENTVEGFFAETGGVLVEDMVAFEGVRVDIGSPRTSSAAMVVDGRIDPDFGGEVADEALWLINGQLSYRWHVYSDPSCPHMTHGSLVAWHRESVDGPYTATETIIECVIECEKPALMLCLEAFVTTLVQATGAF